MDKIEFYELVHRIKIPARIATAAVWSCAICGRTIDSMGGPGSGEICTECGDDILAGKLRYERKDVE